MSDQDSNVKAMYESPILVPLGTLAKGSGVCTTGSSVVNDSGGSGGSGGNNGECTAGAGVMTFSDCEPGYTATQDCTAGPTATRDCSAGTAANRACTAGVAATVGCTAGSAL